MRCMLVSLLGSSSRSSGGAQQGLGLALETHSRGGVRCSEHGDGRAARRARSTSALRGRLHASPRGY